MRLSSIVIFAACAFLASASPINRSNLVPFSMQKRGNSMYHPHAFGDDEGTYIQYDPDNGQSRVIINGGPPITFFHTMEPPWATDGQAPNAPETSNEPQNTFYQYSVPGEHTTLDIRDYRIRSGSNNELTLTSVVDHLGTNRIYYPTRERGQHTYTTSEFFTGTAYVRTFFRGLGVQFQIQRKLSSGEWGVAGRYT